MPIRPPAAPRRPGSAPARQTSVRPTHARNPLTRPRPYSRPAAGAYYGQAVASFGIAIGAVALG
ncbi:hypothetical protein ABT024_28640, partial [Streptomyces sp. NPDC002812]